MMTHEIRKGVSFLEKRVQLSSTTQWQKVDGQALKRILIKKWIMENKGRIVEVMVPWTIC
tara:strand:- start:311 stop:490 length:180 start_codon:yes stop_codon:yes gene_type:complete